MKRLFFNWLGKNIAAAKQNRIKGSKAEYDHSDVLSNSASQMVSAPGTRRFDTDANLNFRMYKAYNGHVMEVSNYDRRTDRHSNNIHIIGQDEDLGQCISNIILLETLKAT